MSLLDFPILKDSKCERLEISGRLLLGKTEHDRLRKLLKSRSRKTLHAALLRYDSTSGIALSEHFGIDPVDNDLVSTYWADVPRRCLKDEGPVALFHWRVQAFPATVELGSFVEDQGLVERVNEWMSTLSIALEVNVSAFMIFPMETYRSIVQLPLNLPREQLGGFTEAPGVWLVKREGDSASGPTIYEVNISVHVDGLRLRVAFASLARGTTETIQSLLEAVKQVAIFAVVQLPSSPSTPAVTA